MLAPTCVERLPRGAHGGAAVRRPRVSAHAGRRRERQTDRRARRQPLDATRHAGRLPLPQGRRERPVGEPRLRADAHRCAQANAAARELPVVGSRAARRARARGLVRRGARAPLPAPAARRDVAPRKVSAADATAFFDPAQLRSPTSSGASTASTWSRSTAPAHARRAPPRARGVLRHVGDPARQAEPARDAGAEHACSPDPGEAPSPPPPGQ